MKAVSMKAISMVAVLVAAAICGAPAQADLVTLANPTFENADNFLFASNSGDISIDSTNVGQWIYGRSHEDDQMDIADIQSNSFNGGLNTSGNSYLQDGTTSLLFQNNSRRSVAQIIDVRLCDMSAGPLTLSAIFSSQETGADREGILSMAGYNDLTGLTVDLVGSFSAPGGFTGGTQAFNYGTTTVSKSEMTNESVVKSLTNSSTVDFDYLVIILGGDASNSNSGSDFVAVDNVQLSLPSAVPEPSSFALLAVAGLSLIIRRRNFS